MKASMDDERYDKTSRWKIAGLCLPPALLLTLLGGYWTLMSWGVFNDDESRTLGAVGPILAALGVALAWVCLRPRR